MIDSMSPGTTVVTSLESYPGVQLSVALRGKTVAASFGNATATAQVRWELPHDDPDPGSDYSFTLERRRSVGCAGAGWLRTTSRSASPW